MRWLPAEGDTQSCTQCFQHTRHPCIIQSVQHRPQRCLSVHEQAMLLSCSQSYASWRLGLSLRSQAVVQALACFASAAACQKAVPPQHCTHGTSFTLRQTPKDKTRTSVAFVQPADAMDQTKQVHICAKACRAVLPRLASKRTLAKDVHMQIYRCTQQTD